jgi:hypothetical protein
LKSKGRVYNKTFSLVSDKTVDVVDVVYVNM